MSTTTWAGVPQIVREFHLECGS